MPSENSTPSANAAPTGEDYHASDLRELNRQLVDSEQRLRLALETGRIGLWVWNSSDVANAGDWSPRLREIFGIPLTAEVTHDVFLNCVHPDDREKVDAAVMNALGGANDGEYRMEYRSIHPRDGSLHWVTAHGQAFFDDQKRPIRFIGTVMDITDRKEAEVELSSLNRELESRIAERTRELELANAALLRSEDRLRRVIDTIPGLVFTSSPEGSFDYLNKRWLDYTGMSLEDSTGWGWQVAIHPDDLPGLTRYWKALLQAGVPGKYESRMRGADGQYRWFLSRAVPYRNETGEIVKWYGTKVDIEGHRASMRLLRNQFDAITDLLDSLSTEGDSEKLVEHVARVIRDQTASDVLTFWIRNDAGVIDRMGIFSDNRLQFPAESASADQIAALRALGHPVWNRFFETCVDCVELDFASDPPMVRIAGSPGTNWMPALGCPPTPALLEDYLRKVKESGTLTAVTVPMPISGSFGGMVSARFRTHRTFRDEELELLKTLAQQAMLTIEMMRLARIGRQSAVISERNRLAREIHDTLAQGLTGVIVQLEAAEDARSQELDAEAGAHIARARELAAESLKEARRSVHAIRPEALSRMDLCAALADLIEKATSRTSVRGSVSVEGDSRPLPKSWEDNLLRIAQEALTNVLRHSRATEFHAKLAFASGSLQLALSDNGQGFDPTQKPDGFGLRGMRERVEAMDGSLTVESHPGTGTRIAVVLTLPSPTDENRIA
ncbi:PAS domain S-box-containing protein [Terrimicrobium sacchariphilum]|uniref:PAS domain S-box-containing protein n=1 Tax=Terrimicrobium sacchariphilum TaxID=690879 RepID=A0A146GB72_TERSA|nr:PAS domain-containing protein [Terrimicrobium sacchariphilum]GAT34879.1 PAS domain S-box-containing protein [Terrimicrobium sacchariphilum]